jgi:hypothetical protein
VKIVSNSNATLDARLEVSGNLDAMRTDVREHLAHLARDVTVTIPSTSEKGVTFTVIFLMDLPEVSKEPLGVGRLLEVLQSH